MQLAFQLFHNFFFVCMCVFFLCVERKTRDACDQSYFDHTRVDLCFSLFAADNLHGTRIIKQHAALSRDESNHRSLGRLSGAQRRTSSRKRGVRRRQYSDHVAKPGLQRYLVLGCYYNSIALRCKACVVPSPVGCTRG